MSPWTTKGYLLDSSIVEYGCGSNFLVDELLKTRTGENVLALLTSVSIIREEEYGEVLSLLYDGLKAPTHSTPSVGQLDRLRSTCMPLARKMNFKDRLAEMHRWITNAATTSELEADKICDTRPKSHGRNNLGPQ